MNASEDLMSALWDCGYTVAELWGFTKPVSRGTSLISEPHGLLWGILAIVEQQVDKGAGHKYFRQRIGAGDWVGIGYQEASVETKRLVIIPPIQDAKFGRQKSAVGDGISNYINVRFIHHKLMENDAITAGGPRPNPPLPGERP